MTTKERQELVVFEPIYEACKKKEFARAFSLLTIDGEIRKIFRTDLNHAYYILGDIYIRQEKDYEAARAFCHSIKNDPSDFIAMNSLGVACTNLGMIWLGTTWVLLSGIFDLSETKIEFLKRNIEEIGYIKNWTAPSSGNNLTDPFYVYPEQTRLVAFLIGYTLSEIESVSGKIF